MVTTRHNRALAALQPGWLALDERTPRQLLAQLAPTAALFNYIDEQGSVRGRWDAFYTGIPLVRYAMIAEIDLRRITQSFRQQLANLPRATDDEDSSRRAAAWNVIDQLLRLYLRIDHEARAFAEIPGESVYAARLRQAIPRVLREDYINVVEWANRLGLHLRAPFPIAGLRNLWGPFWLPALHTDDWKDPRASTRSRPAADAEFATHLTRAAWSTLAVLENLVSAAANEFERHYAAPAGLPPHFALYLAFLRHFSGAQAAMNEIPGRHLDYHFREVLGLKPAPAEPDRAWVAFEVEAGTRVELPRGAAVLGSVKGTEAAVRYRLDEPLTITPSRLSRVATTWLSEEPRSDGTGFYVSLEPRAEVAAKPSRATKGWAPFGEDQEGLADGQRTMDVGWGGFAVSSPTLHLEDGARLLIVRVRFASAADEGASGLAAGAFAPRVDFTSAEGWVRARAVSVALRFCDNATGPVPLAAEFTIALGPSEPPCTDCESAKHGTEFPGGHPVLRVSWPHPLAAFACDRVEVTRAFAQAPVAQIEIEVSVQDMRNLTLVGPSGVLPPGPALPVFGVPPLVGARCAIGKRELFRKPLTALELTIDWDGLPTNPQRYPHGLRDYYADCLTAIANPPPETFRNDQYRARFAALEPMGPVVAATSTPFLFDWAGRDAEPPRREGVLAPSSRWVFASPENLPRWANLSEPLVFNPAAPVGFLTLTLEAPDYAFGHGLYPSVVTAIALRNATEATRVGRVRKPAAADGAPPASAFAILRKQVWWTRLMPRPAWILNPKLFPLWEKNLPPPARLAEAFKAAGTREYEVWQKLKAAKDRQFHDEAEFNALIDSALPSNLSPDEVTPVREELVFWLASLLARSPVRHPVEPAITIAPAPMPPPPLVLNARDVRISYKAATTIRLAPSTDPANEVDRIWSLNPLAPQPLPLRHGPLYAPPPAGGCLYLGFEHIETAETVSLLVVPEPATTGIPTDAPAPAWSYLHGNAWTPFVPTAVHDGTRGFRRSGILRLELPAKADVAHDILPRGLVWVRAQAAAPTGRPRVRRILSHATEVVWAPAQDLGAPDIAAHFAAPLPSESIAELEKPHPDILPVEQPLPGFGGAAPETEAEFLTRVSERLRHKGRAVTSGDYERLLLRQFRSVLSARALPPRNPDDAGELEIVVLPLATPLSADNPRAFAAAELEDMQAALRRVAPLSARVRVTNPTREPVEVRIAVRFAQGQSFDRGRARLDEELKRHLVPWAFDADAIAEIPSSFDAASVSAFVRSRPYVRAAEGCTLRIAGESAPGRAVVTATSPRTQLVSAAAHAIEPLEP